MSMVSIITPKTRRQTKSLIDIEDEGCVLNDATFADNASIINGITEELRTCQRKYEIFLPGGQLFTQDTITIPSGVTLRGIDTMMYLRHEDELATTNNAGQFSNIVCLGGAIPAVNITGHGATLEGFGIQGRRYRTAGEGPIGTRSTQGVLISGATTPPVGAITLNRLSFGECATNIETEGTQHADSITLGKCIAQNFSKHVRLNNEQSVGLEIVGEQTLLGDTGFIGYECVNGGVITGDGMNFLNAKNATLLKLGTFDPNNNYFRLTARFGDGFTNPQTLCAVDLSAASSANDYAYPFAVWIDGVIAAPAGADVSNFVKASTVGSQPNDKNVHLRVQGLLEFAGADYVAKYPWANVNYLA